MNQNPHVAQLVECQYIGDDVQVADKRVISRLCWRPGVQVPPCGALEFYGEDGR